MTELALYGGNPVRNEYLSYGRHWIDESDMEAVIEVLRGDYLTTGPYVKEFETKIADYVGAKYAVAVSNGTAGLHIACLAAGISEGDEVIVSSLTFAASANCVLYCGGTPVFADIDSRNYNVDPKEIGRLITPKTKAIVAVDFAGQAVDMDTIKEIADKHNLIVIEDAAHALGSEYKGEKVGPKPDMTMFSLHPVKPITTAEGGVMVTNDDDLYKKLMLFRSHGIEKNPEYLYKTDGPWYHEQQVLGYNYRLTDVQSALGSSQMDKIDRFITRRRDIAKKYNESFKNIDEIITPFQEDYSNSGWHLYVIQIVPDLLSVRREEIFKALQAENIGVNVHYIPVYYHPYYQELGYEKGLCPNAELFYERAITLPLYPRMTDDDVEDVINAVKKVINYFRK